MNSPTGTSQSIRRVLAPDWPRRRQRERAGAGRRGGGGRARVAARHEKCCRVEESRPSPAKVFLGLPGWQTVAVGGNHVLQVRTTTVFQALQKMVTIFFFFLSSA